MKLFSFIYMTENLQGVSKKKKKKKKKTKTFFEIGIIPLFIKESSKFLYGLSKMIFFALLKSPYIAVLKKEVTS